MPFTLQHILVSELLYPETHETAQGISFSVSAQGSFQLLYPGRLQRDVQATVRHSMRIDTPNPTVPDPPGPIDGPGHPPHPTPTPQPLHNGVQVTLEAIPLDLRIYDPNGQLFTRDEVTLSDLQKFRDLRGTPVGEWRFTLSGQSKLYMPSPAFNESVTDPKGVINLSLLENVVSASAPPLVARSQVNAAGFHASFDLNRVGRFHAGISTHFPFPHWQGSIELFDPDGIRVAGATASQLNCPIPLSALGKSRDAAGNPRLWTLKATPQHASFVSEYSITATVLGEGRITTASLQDRIQKLLGPHGSFISLVGENSGGVAKAMLTITDVVAAETIDMHGLLDSRLKAEGQSTDIKVGVPMMLYHHDQSLDYGLTLDVSTLKLRSLDLEIGPGRGLGAQTPVLRLVIAIDGQVKVRWEGQTVATAGLHNGRAELEIGMRIDPDGTPRIITWVSDDPFDIDVDNTVIAALVLALGVIGGVSVIAITEYIESVVNERFSKGAAALFDDPSLAPTILMTMFGAHLNYLPVRFEGSDILFEHVAPAEPDPKPRHDYAGAIGRTPMLEAIGHPIFHPLTLGDTWAADHLKSKIDHIVVVMMENRSYDHVLGYRAQAPISDGADGLTDELMAAVNAAFAAPHPTTVLPEGVTPLPPMHPLRRSAFDPDEKGHMTRILNSIGHELDDVRQQLAHQIDGPAGRKINDPQGFVDDFREHYLGGQTMSDKHVSQFDVLGYYETRIDEQASDLPISDFLANNYAYCDRYFCSHPGPTLPNRMFSLTGDVQHDRLGVPILDNNHGDNFLLSRAPTIYDLLTRKGVSWRVYESNPSVTMLRMFARYATDDVNIRPLGDLARDVAAGTLPSFSAVEPAMHHHPQNDDHPDADMYRGQIFLKQVYDTLRSNPDVWRKTLLIVTYDEHGGLYDHAVPPIADVLSPPTPGAVSTGGPRPTTEGLSDGSGPVGGGAGAGGGGSSTGGATGHGHLGGLHISPDLLNILTHAGTLVDAGPVVPVNATLQIAYGVRVPTFVISPWVTPARDPSSCSTIARSSRPCWRGSAATRSRSSTTASARHRASKPS
jgi:phospholipase C